MLMVFVSCAKPDSHRRATLEYDVYCVLPAQSEDRSDSLSTIQSGGRIVIYNDSVVFSGDNPLSFTMQIIGFNGSEEASQIIGKREGGKNAIFLLRRKPASRSYEALLLTEGGDYYFDIRTVK